MTKLLCFTPVLLLALLAGCGHKTEAKTELQKAADVLAKPDPEPTQAAAPVPAAPSLPAAPPAEAPAAPVVPPAQQMRDALASYKDGELEDAVRRLQNLRALRNLTPQQRMAVQDSVAAVMAEIYDLAAKGNPKAIQAVKQYEDMQTRRR